jgi:hypothetical protein
LSFAAAAIAWHSVEVIDVEEVALRDAYMSRALPRHQLHAASILIDEEALHAGTTEQELQVLLPRLQELSDDDPDTPRRIERSPGNVSLRRIEGTTYFCAYDPTGLEHRLRLPARASTQPSP